VTLGTDPGPRFLHGITVGIAVVILGVVLVAVFVVVQRTSSSGGGVRGMPPVLLTVACFDDEIAFALHGVVVVAGPAAGWSWLMQYSLLFVESPFP
jgi:hypothetical protein